MKKRILISVFLIIIVSFLMGLAVFFRFKDALPEKSPEVPAIETPSSPITQVQVQKDEEVELKPPVILEKKTVPFTSQAPIGEWSDTHFQNGCEEASLLMVERWYTGKSLTKEEAKEEILRIEKFEEKRFGTFIDTSIEDTQKILEEYYGIKSSRIARDTAIEDIVKAVEENNLVVLPADGRKLKNPNFRQPGPPRHMLVVIGYDAVTKEFITNDPGTRNGMNYRYNENILYNAILDYPTGDHAPVKSESKVMLVVSQS